MRTITSVEALSDTHLQVSFNNGKTVHASVANYLDTSGYQSLRDPDVFARVKVAQWGHAVEWPGDIGIPIEALRRLA